MLLLSFARVTVWVEGVKGGEGYQNCKIMAHSSSHPWVVVAANRGSYCLQKFRGVNFFLSKNIFSLKLKLK